MSVRTRRWKTRKGEDREAYIVDYTDASGKRHGKNFRLKNDATAYHHTVNVEVASGTHTPSSKSKTLKEAGDLWIKTCETYELERATIDSYRQHLNLHIVPYLGKLKLSELTTPLIRKFEDDLREGNPAFGEANGKKRSPAMIKRIVVSLGTLLADAQERGFVAQNAVRSLRARRVRGKDRRQRGKLRVGMDIPSPDEIKRIIAHLKGNWRPLLLTAIFTGLRASELRGVRWSDVDLKRGELHVRQRADKYKEIGRPKSEAGERTVPLPPNAITALKEWKLAYPRPFTGKRDADNKLIRETPKPDHYVFPTGTGEIEDHANIVHRGLQPVQIAAGLTAPVLDKKGKPKLDDKGKRIMGAKYPGLHALRHFYASWCINRKEDGGLGLPMKLVQERLGHSTINLTADVYGHLFPRGDDGSEMAAAEKHLLA